MIQKVIGNEYLLASPRPVLVLMCHLPTKLFHKGCYHCFIKGETTTDILWSN